MNSEVENITSVEQLYKSVGTNGDAALLLAMRSWLTQICEFDTLSGESLKTDLDNLLSKISQTNKNELQKDRFFHLLKHCEEAILYLIKEMREKIIREHEVMPIYAVREVDMNTIIWLSSKPGRNVKQKLSSKPEIKAVRRRASFDTLENRLLKFMCVRMEELLSIREDVFENHTEELENLYLQIIRYLHNDEVKEIQTWTNERPNNVLLSDKRYKKVLNSYNWLRSIDDDIKTDFENKYKHLLNMVFWNVVAKFSQQQGAKIPQIPLKTIDYHTFNLEPFCQIRGKIGKKDVKFYFHNSDTCFKMNNKCDFWGRRCVDSNEINNNSYFSIEYQSRLLDIKYDELGVYCVDTKTNDCFYCFNSNERDLEIFTGVIFSYFDLKNPLFAETNLEKLAESKITVIDICVTSPVFYQNGNNNKIPFKLLNQKWIEGEKYYNANCKNSKAIYLKDGILTDSMYKICSQKKDENNIMLSFIEQIRDYLPTEQLLYLLPDNANDFETSNIRKAMNFYFAKTEPLPKSIAAIFAFQNSQDFVNVKNKDEFYIVDTCREGYSVTKIQATYSKEVEKCIPETKGIIWERYPTRIVKENWLQKLKDILKTEVPEDFAETLLKLFGREIANYSDMSFIDNENKWHEVSESVCKQITDFVQKSVETFVKTEKIKNPFIVSESILAGAEILNKWQQQAGKLNLWYDHLPELKIKIPINGVYDYFYLVKEARISPKFGEKTKIPIKQRFTLSAGKDYYAFPLFQGESGNNLAYDMRLESKQFPFAKDVDCKLELTYTYGEENPYELIFTANGIQPIKAEWKSRQTIDLDKLPFPDFPPKKTWAEFRKFPRRDSNETSDLIDWIERKAIKPICDCKAKQQDIYQVSFGAMCYWRTDNRGKHYLHYNLFLEKFVLETIFFHEDNFDNRTKNQVFNRPFNGQISFDKEVSKRQNGYIARNISTNVSKIKINNKLLHSLKTTRFPVITIWNNGKSRFDRECPSAFSQKIEECISVAEKLLISKDVNEKIKDGLYKFFAYLNNDAPNFIGHYLQNILANNEIATPRGNRDFFANTRAIAYSIGSCELIWQQDLLKKAISLINGKYSDSAYFILSVAFWRNEKTIHFLNFEMLSKILSNLSEKLNNEVSANNNYAYWYLETLLALLRLRKNENEDFRKILSPNNEIIAKCIDTVDKITKIIIDKKLKPISYLIIDNKNKPQSFAQTPDLLYALRMYLSGDDGANTISITGLNEPNEE